MLVRSLNALALLSVLVCLLSACGEDDPERTTFETNNGSDMSVDPDMGAPDDAGESDAGEPDAGETDGGNVSVCTDDECVEGFKCVRGDCVPNSAQLACDEVEDLGELEADGSAMVTGDTTDFVDTQDASCIDVVDGFSGPENAFKFTVADRARISIELTSMSTNLTWAFSVNRGTCLNGTEAICTIANTSQFIAQPGEDYFIVVQPDSGVDTGQFALQIDLEPIACLPNERTCMGDAVQLCGQTDSFSCSGNCSDGVCQGDTCANPIEVTAGLTLNGAARSNQGEYNFVDRESCQSIDTPGQDFVLSFPSLTAGQMIIVDASQNDDLDHAIFVSETCDATAECLTSIDLGDRLEYTVENDGDYFVFVDKLSGSTGDYEVSADIQ